MVRLTVTSNTISLYDLLRQRCVFSRGRRRRQTLHGLCCSSRRNSGRLFVNGFTHQPRFIAPLYDCTQTYHCQKPFYSVLNTGSEPPPPNYPTITSKETKTPLKLLRSVHARFKSLYCISIHNSIV